MVAATPDQFPNSPHCAVRIQKLPTCPAFSTPCGVYNGNASPQHNALWLTVPRSRSSSFGAATVARDNEAAFTTPPRRTFSGSLGNASFDLGALMTPPHLQIPSLLGNQGSSGAAQALPSISVCSLGFAVPATTAQVGCCGTLAAASVPLGKNATVPANLPRSLSGNIDGRCASFGSSFPRAVSVQSVHSAPPQLPSTCDPNRALPSKAARLVQTEKTVTLNNRTFERLRKLGHGSFATVWEAQEVLAGMDPMVWPLRTALALKVSMPANPQMFDACILEAEILQQLSASLPEKVVSAKRVPEYIAHGITRATDTVPTVFTAMSKLDGMPLDQWLYGVDENVLKTMSMAKLLDGPLPGGQLATRDLEGACATAAALASQLAPVFAALGSVAFHRDVSAHNFLVKAKTAGNEEFSLLDFGLAVRASSWHSEHRRKDIAGDPRYFTPAAWMLIVHGLDFMEAFPDTNLMRQYVHRIDEFSFGVLMLEVLFALWQGPAGEQGLEEAERDVLEGVKQAWRSFWASTVGLFQKFHAEGPGAARDVLAQAFAASGHLGKLTSLCSALRTASKSLQQQQQQQQQQRKTGLAASVFDVAAELIDPRGVLSWQDLPRQMDKATSTSNRSPQNMMAEKSEGIVPRHDANMTQPRRALVTTAPNWANVLESNVSWAAIGMTRKLLDVAWSSAALPRRHKLAFC